MLARFVRAEILGEESKERTVVPFPQDVYLQQGDLIFRRVPK
jgi:hypothetical protein